MVLHQHQPCKKQKLNNDIPLSIGITSAKSNQQIQGNNISPQSGNKICHNWKIFNKKKLINKNY